MKVKELVAELMSQENQEAELYFAMEVGCCSEKEWLTLRDVEQHKDGFFFYFNPMDGYETCRKVSAINELIAKSK